jgi:ABC-type transport system involved in multi-copper enzyme maturation permease subunit
MLKVIIKKEIQETLTSPKFVFTFILCSILVLLSIFTGITAFREEQKEYSAAIALNKENLNRAKSHVTLATLGIKINRPPQVLGSIVTGVSEASGRVATVTYLNDPSLVDSKYESSPIFSIFGALDLAFIVKVVLSLFAILYSYDLIVGEKEHGTLRLILSNRVPRDTLLLGKVISGYISLLVSLIIPLILGVLILLIYPNIYISEQDGLRIVLIFLLFFLYLSVYFALGLFVSANSSRSSSSFLILLFVWVAFVALIPKVSILTATQLRPIKSIHEITAQKDAFLRQAQEEGVSRARDWGNSHTPKTEQEEKDYPEEFKKFLEEQQQWLTSRIDDYNATLDRDYEGHKRSQERVAINLSRISPASALVFSTMSLARTGLDEQDRFLASVRRYKVVFAEWINAQSQKTFKYNRVLGDRPLVDLAGMPQFTFEPESLSKSLARVLPDVGLMAVLIIVLYVGAYISFRKYDIR